ncbi:MAG: hypothetical protein H6744_11075 [Deltaproteobacteria bacterium]|nr:hypothetical protein [Deltaproteobacteria bacterium]MCB9787222.1 hypothetical protein [Deltaproteobacteria bacterium]
MSRALRVVALAFCVLAACATHRVELERTHTERVLPNTLAMWGSWAETSADAVRVRINVESRAAGAIAIPVDTLTCDMAERPGRVELSDHVASKGNIVVYPFDVVSFTLTCHLDTRPGGALRIVVPQVFDADSRTENGLGPPITSYFFWRVNEHLLH